MSLSDEELDAMAARNANNEGESLNNEARLIAQAREANALRARVAEFESERDALAAECAVLRKALGSIIEAIDRVKPVPVGNIRACAATALASASPRAALYEAGDKLAAECAAMRECFLTSEPVRAQQNINRDWLYVCQVCGNYMRCDLPINAERPIVCHDAECVWGKSWAALCRASPSPLVALYGAALAVAQSISADESIGAAWAEILAFRAAEAACKESPDGK